MSALRQAMPFMERPSWRNFAKYVHRGTVFNPWMYAVGLIAGLTFITMIVTGIVFGVATISKRTSRQSG